MEDLAELWLEGCVMAVVHAAGAEQGYWVDDTGLSHDDGSSNWWQLIPFGGDRAVLMGKDHELSGDLYDDLPQALSAGPGWLRDAWARDDRGLRSTVRAKAPIGFFHWADADGTQDRVPTDGADDGSGLVRAPYSGFNCRLFEPYYEVGDLNEAYAFADALFAAARARALTAEVLLPVLGCADPDRTRPFDLDSALRTAAAAGLTSDSRISELPFL
ncbi:hypothetical protein ADL29_10405 [Streptomyces chattanoogensis]|uniref:Uncharacterized protein n=2 Tax=Streptomyces chattanoogensis TaxID=66876 RepID=A0A0N0H1L7_9ACTN|nr:hypothetical protein ADL29_10405 [Streptomyces chattanoogensis]